MSPSDRVLPTPITKPKVALVTPLPSKGTEPQAPELVKPKDVMKPPIKRVNSTNSLSEQVTDGTVTTTASTTSAEKPVPPPHTNGQSIQKPNGLPAPPRDPRPKKKLKPPPRPNPGASLFIPSKKVCHSLILPYSRPYSLTTLHRDHFLTQTRRDRARDDIRLLVYHGIPPVHWPNNFFISTHTTL